MNKMQADKPEVRRWHNYTLGQYVALRNGVSLGDGRCLHPDVCQLAAARADIEKCDFVTAVYPPITTSITRCGDDHSPH